MVEETKLEFAYVALVDIKFVDPGGVSTISKKILISILFWRLKTTAISKDNREYSFRKPIIRLLDVVAIHFLENTIEKSVFSDFRVISPFKMLIWSRICEKN
jgi:hypothetical protein